MKKIVLFFLTALLAVFVITSCTKDCKMCKSVKIDNITQSTIDEGASSEYCDAALDEKENDEPYNDGSTTTKWVCE